MREGDSERVEPLIVGSGSKDDDKYLSMLFGDLSDFGPPERAVPEGRAAEEQLAGDQPTEEQPEEERVAEERPAEERGAEERPAEERGAEERPAEERGAEERPAEERPAEQPAAAMVETADATGAEIGIGDRPRQLSSGLPLEPQPVRPFIEEVLHVTTAQEAPQMRRGNHMRVAVLAVAGFLVVAGAGAAVLSMGYHWNGRDNQAGPARSAALPQIAQDTESTDALAAAADLTGFQGCTKGEGLSPTGLLQVARVFVATTPPAVCLPLEKSPKKPASDTGRSDGQATTSTVVGSGPAGSSGGSAPAPGSGSGGTDPGTGTGGGGPAPSPSPSPPPPPPPEPDKPGNGWGKGGKPKGG